MCANQKGRSLGICVTQKLGIVRSGIEGGGGEEQILHFCQQTASIGWRLGGRQARPAGSFHSFLSSCCSYTSYLCIASCQFTIFVLLSLFLFKSSFLPSWLRDDRARERKKRKLERVELTSTEWSPNEMATKDREDRDSFLLDGPRYERN